MNVMNNFELTAVGSIRSINLVQVRYGVQRKWKIAGLIAVVVSILVVIIGTIIISKYSKHSSTDTLINVTTTITSTHSSSIDYWTLFPLRFNITEMPLAFPLGHSLYFNTASLNEIEGYVVNITLRLFTDWEGDHPLYIFALKQRSLRSAEITHRYAVIPQRKTTQWQTIAIPFEAFPIHPNSFVGVGMQDRSDTNQIYAEKSTVLFYQMNITNNTQYIQLKPNFLQGVAFECIAVSNHTKIRR